MSDRGAFFLQMQRNVALSRRHITKQEVILAVLAEQGHRALVDKAADLLTVMNDHLLVELKVLRYLEAEAVAERPERTKCADLTDKGFEEVSENLSIGVSVW